jgi:hypothetical protein
MILNFNFISDMAPQMRFSDRSRGSMASFTPLRKKSKYKYHSSYSYGGPSDGAREGSEFEHQVPDRLKK